MKLMKKVPCIYEGQRGWLNRLPLELVTLCGRYAPSSWSTRQPLG